MRDQRAGNGYRRETWTSSTDDVITFEPGPRTRHAPGDATRHAPGDVAGDATRDAAERSAARGLLAQAEHALATVTARIPQRTRLIAAVLAIVAAAFAVIGIAGISALRGHQLDIADTELRVLAEGNARWIGFAQSTGYRYSWFAAQVPPGFVVQYRGDAGELVREFQRWENQNEHGPRLPADPDQLQAQDGRPFTVPATAGDHSWRILTTRLPDGAGTVILARDLGTLDRTVQWLVTINVVVGGFALVALVAMGLSIVRAGRRPVTEIEEATQAVAAGELSWRLPESDERAESDHQVTRALNELLAQIETTVAGARGDEERIRRSVVHAGRELRAPVSVIQGFADYYRQLPAHDSGRLDRLVGRVENEASRMGTVVENLLALARADGTEPVISGREGGVAAGKGKVATGSVGNGNGSSRWRD